MIQKFQGIYVSGTTATTTSPVELGADNCATVDAWLLSKSGTTATCQLHLDGSNDGINWVLGLTSTVVGTSAPRFKSLAYTDVVPYGQVRARLAMPSGSETAVLDALIRTFRTA